MPIIGVLSGDVVASREISDKPRLRRAIDAGLDLLHSQCAAVGIRFRGDAFQLALPDPAETIRAAVIMRASLIEHSPCKQQIWDARIAIGIGKGNMPSQNAFIDADGEPFVRSGQGLDRLGQGDQRLGLFLQPPRDDLDLLTRFADDIISHWSHNAAEVIRWNLTTSLSQRELATQIGRTQPTVNRRLTAARWSLIQEYMRYAREALVAATEEHADER